MRRMQGSDYAHLLSPGRIGAMALRNRIAMTPMGTNQERDDGFLGERILGYYEARAKGGAGLIIAGVAAITWPDGACNPYQAALSDDRFLPDWEEFARRCHRHGAKAAAQLQHAGKVAQEDVKAGRPMWTPSEPTPGNRSDMFADLTPTEMAQATSAYRAPGAKASYHVMDEADIAWVVARFADAAARAQAAGLDGIELHAGHGYMLQAFLSAKSNRRDDRWGGSLENRARLMTEVIKSVRERVGHEMAVWCRIDGEEIGVTGGITLDDAVEAAVLAEAAGADAVHVSAYADPTSGPAFTEAPLPHEPARYLPFAAAVKKRLSIPVIAVGRIDPEVGNAAIAQGRCDFVAMGRRLLADPELPNQLAAATPEKARPCIYSYQCVGNAFLRIRSQCTINPQMGEEFRGVPAGTNAPRRVAVIGAGPAGLEASRILAERGHTVVLHEAAAELGGRLRVSAALDPQVEELVRWYEARVREAGVIVRTGHNVVPEDISSTADHFVVATGAVRRGQCPGAETAVPAEAIADLLLESAPGRVAVVGSDVIGVKAAEALALAGHDVVLIESGGFAPQMGLPRRWRAADALARCGAERVAVTAVESIERDGVTVTIGDDPRRLDVERVVWASGLTPGSSLADALRAAGKSVTTLGDAASVGYLHAAISDAAAFASEL